MLKWFGHMERIEEGKITRRVYMSEIEGGNVRGQPPVKWRGRVQEFVRERGEGSLRNLEQAERECQDRERWKLFCRGHPLGLPLSDTAYVIRDSGLLQCNLPSFSYIYILFFLILREA